MMPGLWGVRILRASKPHSLKLTLRPWKIGKRAPNSTSEFHRNHQFSEPNWLDSFQGGCKPSGRTSSLRFFEDVSFLSSSYLAIMKPLTRVAAWVYRYFGGAQMWAEYHLSFGSRCLIDMSKSCIAKMKAKKNEVHLTVSIRKLKINTMYSSDDCPSFYYIYIPIIGRLLLQVFAA